MRHLKNFLYAGKLGIFHGARDDFIQDVCCGPVIGGNSDSGHQAVGVLVTEKGQGKMIDAGD